MFCAFGLALAPAGVANAHADPTMRMSNCAMQMVMAHMDMHPMHHGKKQHSAMDCCSPACHAPAPIAIAAASIGESVLPLQTAHFDAGPVKHLVSAIGSTTDPPPRT